MNTFEFEPQQTHLRIQESCIEGENLPRQLLYSAPIDALKPRLLMPTGSECRVVLVNLVARGECDAPEPTKGTLGNISYFGPGKMLFVQLQVRPEKFQTLLEMHLKNVRPKKIELGVPDLGRDPDVRRFPSVDFTAAVMEVEFSFL